MWDCTQPHLATTLATRKQEITDEQMPGMCVRGWKRVSGNGISQGSTPEKWEFVGSMSWAEREESEQLWWAEGGILKG